MGSLEKGVAFAPNNDEGRREDLEDTTSNDYFDLIDAYNAKFRQIKGLLGRRANPRVEETIQRLDLERHDIHVRLAEIGSKLGKDANDVVADIMERSGDLREYGLPEFSLMTHHESSPLSFLDLK